jgi:uncharacterized membrane protein YhaH (DUF805 family)
MFTGSWLRRGRARRKNPIAKPRRPTSNVTVPRGNTFNINQKGKFMQNTSSHAGDFALGAGAILFVLAISLCFYLFYCYCLKRICEKAGHQPGILIWLPIVQLIPLLQVAGMALWMILLFLIPFVNLVVIIMMWAKICEARGKSPWLVILMFVPIVNIIFIPYLAFSE